MNIRGPQFDRINQHLIDKAHNRRLIFAVAIIGSFIIVDGFHIQIIEMHIINSAQHLADIFVCIILQPACPETR